MNYYKNTLFLPVMGKSSNKRRRTPKASKMRVQDDTYLDKEIDDEIDAFHKQREMIPLDINKESEDSDDDVEEPVFDLEGYQNGDGDNDSDDDDEKNEDEDMGDESFADVEDKGFTAKIARQAKYLKEKFGGEDEMSDDDEQYEERKVAWGKKKNLYYSADNVDYELQSSDEDLPKEEEAEVLKLQREKAKTLAMEDFGLEASDFEENDFDGEKTFQDLGRKKVTPKPDAENVDLTIDDYKERKKDFRALSKAEQMDFVYSSAPELVSLLSELNMTIDQLRKVKPLSHKELREGKDQLKGMDYFELKHVLLLTYCQAITFYLLLKTEGHPVRDHPVIGRLVEIKGLWEKVKEMSSKFSLQVEIYSNHIDESKVKSNVESGFLEPEPCLVDMPTKALTTPEMPRFLKDSSKGLASKCATKKQQDSQRDLKSIEMMKVREDLEAKLKQKGIYDSIKEKVVRAPKDFERPINRGLVTANDFDDEVRHSKHHGPNFSHQSLNKLAQNALAKKNGWKIISGDDDLPKRDDIAERRRKHELRVLARAGVVADGEEGYDSPKINTVGTDPIESEEIESEDEFYREVKKQRAEKLTTKAKLYSRAHFTPMEEPEADGKRQISRQIEKNRGLTRNRKKLTKNPRKKYKIKHQKAVIRRKGQVRDIRKPSGPYGGEPTGINTNVSRSIRFQS